MYKILNQGIAVSFGRSRSWTVGRTTSDSNSTKTQVIHRQLCYEDESKTGGKHAKKSETLILPGVLNPIPDVLTKVSNSPSKHGTHNQ